MKSTNQLKPLLIIILMLTTTIALCQKKEIELTKFYQKTVPNGKVWYVSNTMFHRVIFSEGTFESGTACNAALHSNPNYVFGIICYDTITTNPQLPKVFGFTINEEPVWLHDDVYNVKPYFLISNNVDESVLKYSLTWTFKADEMVFYPGMRLQTSACINNLIIYERDMTVKDKANYIKAKNKQLAINKALQQKDLAYKRDKNAQQLASYNDLSHVYKIGEISNAGLLFQSENFDSACIMLCNTIGSKLNENYQQYHSYIQGGNLIKVLVHVNWDSTGTVLSYKVKSDFPIYNIKLDSVLKLATYPLIEYKSTRRCLLEDDLIFTIDCREEPDGRYYVKKLKNGYRFINNVFPKMERR
jgi:hypothetical protein